MDIATYNDAVEATIDPMETVRKLGSKLVLHLTDPMLGSTNQTEYKNSRGIAIAEFQIPELLASPYLRRDGTSVR